MRDYIDVAVERVKAAPGGMLAATIAALVATVAATVGLALAESAALSDSPHLQMVYVSGLTFVPAGGAYSDAQVAVNNAGTATAEGCYAKAYNHLLFSEEIDEASALGRSEQFDLSARGGHVATVSVHLADLSGEALLGGGIRAPVFFRTECKNAESSEEGRTVTVPFPVSSPEAP